MRHARGIRLHHASTYLPVGLAVESAAAAAEHHLVAEGVVLVGPDRSLVISSPGHRCAPCATRSAIHSSRATSGMRTQRPRRMLGSAPAQTSSQASVRPIPRRVAASSTVSSNRLSVSSTIGPSPHPGHSPRFGPVSCAIPVGLGERRGGWVLAEPSRHAPRARRSLQVGPANPPWRRPAGDARVSRQPGRSPPQVRRVASDPARCGRVRHSVHRPLA
jgi:hypothetical protein